MRARVPSQLPACAIRTNTFNAKSRSFIPSSLPPRSASFRDTAEPPPRARGIDRLFEQPIFVFARYEDDGAIAAVPPARSHGPALL